MAHEYSVIFTTVGKPADATRLADGLVGEHLAACVQCLPIQSTYRWEGAVQHDAETLLLIKARSADYLAIETWLVANHPYTVPEILCLPVEAGLPAYLAWVTAMTARA